MKIKLKGEIHPELTLIGLQAGDEVEGNLDPGSKVGGFHFTVYFRGWKYDCSIWPDNYDIVKPKNNQSKGLGV